MLKKMLNFLSIFGKIYNVYITFFSHVLSAFPISLVICYPNKKVGNLYYNFILNLLIIAWVLE